MVKVILVGLAGALLLLLLLFLMAVIQDHKRSKEIQDRLKIKSPKKENRPAQKPQDHDTASSHPRHTQSTQPRIKEDEASHPPLSTTPPPSQQAERPTKTEETPVSEPAQTAPSAPQKPTLHPLAQEIKEKNYGTFDHSRLVEEMGLGEEEVGEFVSELIHQVEAALPDIEEELSAGNRERMERITHGLKGAALNLGNGGITDVLVEYNTYLKQHDNPDVIRAFQEQLNRHLQKLKTRYAA